MIKFGKYYARIGPVLLMKGATALEWQVGPYYGGLCFLRGGSWDTASLRDRWMPIRLETSGWRDVPPRKYQTLG